ncbi:LuxR family transcriptional regulator [Agrobacterium tumefaciens]|uniref:LuxR family transcriptional regulator n=1 Tax=Agrobacterium tumefaciens TaxID=358 RepID=A0A4D7YKX5_AGRTU|nr:LuxR family transcriptional regulator [Agrobacterium tumefaciens]QCL97981.1 LuxR family transcriptional regulator [Agrobacterium tumefaciens]
MRKLPLSVATLNGAESKRDLDHAIGVIRDLYGFAHMAFLSAGISAGERGQRTYCTTYPVEWIARYIDRDYFRTDPVVATCRTGFLPVDWSSFDKSSKGVREMFLEATALGIGPNGITVPVRGPFGERSVFSAASNASRQDWRALRRSAEHDLMLLSHYMHEKFLIITGVRSNHYRSLSRRERECLQLVARGSVPKRIARQLHLSESAVRLYLANARRKLEARTVYQAIARASFLEFIEV